MVHVVDPTPEPIQILLNRVKTAIGHVGKGERNTQQGFNFRGIDAVVNAAAPHLNEHGIITVPEVISHTYETVEIGAKHTAMGHVTLLAKYHFYGPAGDVITATVMSESMDSGDKAMAKAMSVAYRIALLQVLNLPTTEPDPDSESFERSGKTGGLQEWADAGKTRNTAKTANTPKTGSAHQFGEHIKNANTVELLREVYRAAMQNGVLQDKITGYPEFDGLTVEKAMLKKGDELNFRKSNQSAATVQNASGAPV